MPIGRQRAHSVRGGEVLQLTAVALGPAAWWLAVAPSSHTLRGIASTLLGVVAGVGSCGPQQVDCC